MSRRRKRIASSPPARSAPASPFSGRKVVVIGLAAAVVAGLIWTASASRREPGAADAPRSPRLSARHVKEDPGFVRKYSEPSPGSA